MWSEGTQEWKKCAKGEEEGMGKKMKARKEKGEGDSLTRKEKGKTET